MSTLNKDDLEKAKQANEVFKMAIEGMMIKININAKLKGFWNDENRNKGEMIALMHSELSECLEGIRKPKQDENCPEFTNEEIELADCVIRIMDYAGGFKLRLADAILAKHAYNRTREYKHGKNF